MIAREYLDYRARLDATLGSLAEAARRGGAHAGRPALLRNFVTGLEEPFLFVVAGEAGAGKSTFLDALAGERFCDPGDGAVVYYKFGGQPRDVPGGGGLVEMYRPCEFLRDFHVVEVPGAAAGHEAAATVAERLVPVADLVLVVISVTDAWTPGVWRSMDHIHLGLQKQVLLVLTGCDRRSAEEIRAVVEHMELTMGRRYGRALPIFQVSSAKAFLARTNPAGGGEAKLAESGILEFEEFVSHHLLASEARMERIGNALQAARVVVGELQAPLAETEAILARDGDLLEGLKREINSRYEKTNEKIRREFFGGLDAGHAAAVSMAQSQLAAAASWWSLPGLVFGGGRRIPEGLAEDFKERVAETTEAQVIGAISEAEADVGDLWQTLSARVGEEFEHQLTASDGSGRAVWSGRGERLMRRAEACALKACTDFGIAEAAGEQLRHLAVALRFFAISALVLLAAGVGLFAAGLAPFHLLVGGLGVVALGFGAGQFIDGRRKLRGALAERAEEGRIQLRAYLSSELTSHVHEYYTKLGSLFDPVQELCQEQMEEVAPQIRAVRALDEEVARLSGELAAMHLAAREYLRRVG